MKQNQSIIVVVGATASGKSDFAVELALKMDGEIISADSRQVYKGLDIGTGKITKGEMKGVPHHMLSVYEIGEEVSVARFARDANPIIDDIFSRGKTPIICGGTGQYIDALIFSSVLPKVPPNKELRRELETRTTTALFKELAALDPERAKTVDSHNRVRLIRALEIVAANGKVPVLDIPTLRYNTTIYLLKPARDILRVRIAKRLEKRLALGMLDEVKNLMSKGFESKAMKTFGLEYVTLGRYLEGTLSEEEMKEELITKSMQYAKRQETWNKKYEKREDVTTVIT